MIGVVLSRGTCEEVKDLPGLDWGLPTVVIILPIGLNVSDFPGIPGYTVKETKLFSSVPTYLSHS